VSDVEVGGVYDAVVTEIKDFGAVVEVLRNKEGILHMSEITKDPSMTNSQKGNFGIVSDLLAVGQQLELICTAVDRVRNQIKFSRVKFVEKQIREAKNNVGGNAAKFANQQANWGHDAKLVDSRRVALKHQKEDAIKEQRFGEKRERLGSKYPHDFFKNSKYKTNNKNDRDELKPRRRRDNKGSSSSSKGSSSKSKKRGNLRGGSKWKKN